MKHTTLQYFAVGSFAFAESVLLDWSCPIRAITGFPCPGCGMTRALFSAAKLDFAAAWNFNPLLFISLPTIAFLYLLTKRLGKQKQKTLIITWAVILVVGLEVFRYLNPPSWL